MEPGLLTQAGRALEFTMTTEERAALLKLIVAFGDQRFLQGHSRGRGAGNRERVDMQAAANVMVEIKQFLTALESR